MDSLLSLITWRRKRVEDDRHLRAFGYGEVVGASEGVHQGLHWRASLGDQLENVELAKVDHDSLVLRGDAQEGLVHLQEKLLLVGRRGDSH